MTKRPSTFSTSSLAQQLALVAAALCLLVGLALVVLGVISSKHMHQQLLDEHGAALAELIAARVSTAMETGDLLSITASLQGFVNVSTAEEVTVTDIEGKRLSQAGVASGLARHRYTRPVRIGNDVAGQVTVSLNGDRIQAGQTQLMLSLLGLTLLLGLAVYGATRHFAQQLANRLSTMTERISLEDQGQRKRPRNELLHLEQQVNALPMDLLRTRGEPVQQDENYRTTAVLFLHLSSLTRYVDTLDEQSLQRYTQRLHQIIYAAAGFYTGDIQVARQFGLALYFSGDNKTGSAAFRAASCAWLVRAVCEELQKQMSLSLQVDMAIDQSELGIGDETDIYPGLYMQHTLDELHRVCAGQIPGIVLSESASRDIDISSRLQHCPSPVDSFYLIEEFAGTYQDLLERQLHLIMRRLTAPVITQ